MSCKQYQQLLHLNRSGEIFRQEADELRQHLRLCEKCSLELQRVERADGFIDRLGAFSPVPKNPEELAANILRRVRAESTARRSLNPLDRFLDFFLLPSVRYATVAIVLLITMTFMAQLLVLMNNISDLEQHMASPVRHDATEATYTMQSETLQEVAKSERGKPLRENVYLTMTDGRIDVSAKEVDSFLSGYDLRNLPAILGASALGIDKKTLEKIVNEVKATAGRSFRLDGKGA